MAELKEMRTGQLPRVWPAIHGGLLLAALAIVPVCLPSLVWPWHLLLPLAAYAALVMFLPPLRRSFPRLSAGRVDLAGAAAAVALAVIAAAVLLAYRAIFHPDLALLAASLPVSSFGSLLLAGLCFSLGNAVLEELVFRGVLYESFVAEWGVALAILITGVFFGLIHVRGYPPGPLGIVLAGGYGIGLGLLRWWSGGLGLPIACHVCADATIFGILVSSGVFAETAV